MKSNPSTLIGFTRRLVLLAALAVVMFAMPVLSVAGDATASAAVQHYNLGADKVALKGYDPVGYFTQNAAVKGKQEFNAQQHGVTYYFASDENKKLFTTAPDKYVPTYGGWCATAMARGEKVEIDPTNFKVTKGRLFLFFKAFYANAQKDWNKDEPNQTMKADANWKKIAGE